MTQENHQPVEGPGPMDGPPATGVVHRPPFQLRSLPIRYRWEVTRRHSYYQDWWQGARDYHRNEPVTDPREPLLRQASMVILGVIGVSGEPPDPATEFDQLADHLQAAWLSGAVHPVSFRGLAGLCIASLPEETLATLGTLLLEASREDEENRPPSRIRAVMDLATAEAPGLDSYVQEPIVSINPAASGRQVTEAIQSLLSEWKAERQLSERRDRSDKYQEYLQVWDLREGWTGAAYEPAQERRFREIAGQLRLSVATVNNHYRGAFELIIGYPYSPELWVRTFGALKFMSLGGTGLGPVSGRRPLSSYSRRPVPETRLQAKIKDEDAPGSLIAGVSSPDTSGESDLLSDICTLLDVGRTDQQIANELELSDHSVPAIAYLRERRSEFASAAQLPPKNSADVI
jgi:hypothetical protein